MTRFLLVIALMYLSMCLVDHSAGQLFCHKADNVEYLNREHRGAGLAQTAIALMCFKNSRN